jgi:hypothetical protein
MTTEMERELASAVESGAPLPAIVEQLRDFKRRGASRREVYDFLESMREHVIDEAAEDRILEVMDFVSGFCSPECTIWTE